MAAAYADFSSHLVQAWWITQPILDDGNNPLEIEGGKPALRRLVPQTIEPHHLDKELNSLTFHHDHADRIRVFEFCCYSLQASFDYRVAKPYCGLQTRDVIGPDRTSNKVGVNGNKQIGARGVALVPAPPLAMRWKEDHRARPPRREGNTSSFDKVLTRARLTLQVYHEGMLFGGNLCLLPGQSGSLHDIRPHDAPVEVLMNESVVVRASGFAGVKITCFRQ